MAADLMPTLPTGKSNCGCVICGCRNQADLTHCSVGGLIVVLCRRCERDLIARTTLPPHPIWTPPDDLESIASALLAEADLLSVMAQSRWLLAHALIARVQRDAPNHDNLETGEQ